MGCSQTFGTDQASSVIAKHKPLVWSWVHLPKNLKSRSFVMLFLALLCYFHGVCLQKNQIVQCYFQLNSLVCVLFFDNCLVLPLASCSPEFLSCYLQPTAVGNQGQVFFFWGGGAVLCNPHFTPNTFPYRLRYPFFILTYNLRWNLNQNY